MKNKCMSEDELVKHLQPIIDKHAAAFKIIRKEYDLRKMKFSTFQKLMYDKVDEMK